MQQERHRTIHRTNLQRRHALQDGGEECCSYLELLHVRVALFAALCICVCLISGGFGLIFFMNPPLNVEEGELTTVEQDSIDSVQAWFSTIDADEDSSCVRGMFGHNACLRRPFQCQTTPGPP